jgi:hypothetical protein
MRIRTPRCSARGARPRGHPGQAFLEPLGRIGGRHPVHCHALLRGAERHHGLCAEIRGEADHPAEVVPTSGANACVADGQVQARGSAQERVQAGIAQISGAHAVPDFAPLGGREGGGVGGQLRGVDFNAVIAAPFRAKAGFGERGARESLAAD